MILGLRTTIYPTTDLARAREWYSLALGVAPYFDQPFYVGFAVGGFELGLVPDGTPGTSGAVPYWGVPNADDAIAALLAIGGVLHDAVHDVGDGIRVGAVLDPFGNVFAVIENPHFDVAAVR
jgi:predicted enzyme related to lactoylglutathione lyase